MCDDPAHHHAAVGRLRPGPVEGEAWTPIPLQPVDRDTIEHKGTTRRILFDLGVSPNRLVENSRRLGIDLCDVEAIVCSHGHFDHTAGFDGLVRRLGRPNLPVVTGVSDVAAVIGGFHLGGPLFEAVIGPTVNQLTELAPQLVVAAHCTGWKASHQLAAALPDAYIPNSVGTSFVLARETVA
jgi:metal-dependent hydrolase (beta-lactamase superfamily II)